MGIDYSAHLITLPKSLTNAKAAAILFYVHSSSSTTASALGMHAYYNWKQTSEVGWKTLDRPLKITLENAATAADWALTKRVQLMYIIRISASPQLG